MAKSDPTNDLTPLFEEGFQNHTIFTRDVVEDMLDEPGVVDYKARSTQDSDRAVKGAAARGKRGAKRGVPPKTLTSMEGIGNSRLRLQREGTATFYAAAGAAAIYASSGGLGKPPNPTDVPFGGEEKAAPHPVQQTLATAEGVSGAPPIKPPEAPPTVPPEDEPPDDKPKRRRKSGIKEFQKTLSEMSEDAVAEAESEILGNIEDAKLQRNVSRKRIDGKLLDPRSVRGLAQYGMHGSLDESKVEDAPGILPRSRDMKFGENSLYPQITGAAAGMRSDYKGDATAKEIEARKAEAGVYDGMLKRVKVLDKKHDAAAKAEEKLMVKRAGSAGRAAGGRPGGSSSSGGWGHGIVGSSGLFGASAMQLLLGGGAIGLAGKKAIDTAKTADPFVAGPTFEGSWKSLQISLGTHLLPLLNVASEVLQEVSEKVRPKDGPKSGLFGGLGSGKDTTLWERLNHSSLATGGKKISSQTEDTLKPFSDLPEKDFRWYAERTRKELQKELEQKRENLRLDNEKPLARRSPGYAAEVKRREDELKMFDVALASDGKSKMKLGYSGPTSQIVSPSDYGDMIQKAALNQGGDIETDNLRKQMQNAMESGGLLKDILDVLVNGITVREDMR